MTAMKQSTQFWYRLFVVPVPVDLHGVRFRLKMANFGEKNRDILAKTVIPSAFEMVTLEGRLVGGGLINSTVGNRFLTSFFLRPIGISLRIDTLLSATIYV